MSFGGVHPAEWIFPIVGAHHAFYNTVAGSHKVNTPDSAAAKQASAEKEAAKQAQVLAESRQKEIDAQKLLEEQSKPLTPQQDLESRQRLSSASEFITQQKRAGRTLGAY